MFSMFKKNYKDKISIKLWNSFFDKENVIYEYKINDYHVDLIIVTSTGIYLFLIYSIKGIIKGKKEDDMWIEVTNVDQGNNVVKEEVSSFLNPFINLNGVKKELEKILDKDFIPIYIYPIFDNLKLDKQEIEEEIHTLHTFKESIKGRKKILTNEEINEYTKLIKQSGDFINK